MNPQIAQLLNQAIQYLQAGNLDNAERHASRAVQIEGKNADALHILGVIQGIQHKPEEALGSLLKAVKIKSGDGVLQFNLAKALMETGRYAESLEHYKKSLSLIQNNPDIWVNFGKSLKETQRLEEALSAYQKAIALNPSDAEAWSNKGIILNDLRRYEEAISCFEKAISLNPEEAASFYNLGITFDDLRRHEEAISCYEKALAINPNYAEAWSNKGISLHELKRFEEALSCYEKALAINPNYAEAWSNKGISLHELKRFEEAISCYEKALAINPRLEYLLGRLIYARHLLGNWQDSEKLKEQLIKDIDQGKRVIAPFSLLSIVDSPRLELIAAKTLISHKYPNISPTPAVTKRSEDKKIRIAYFSADFKTHPVAFLTAQMFEIHDRNRFEVFAISLSSTSEQDEMFVRLKKAFDQFVEVEGKSDIEIAQLTRDLEIDIAIDLSGFTKGARTAIFSNRAAPIQVNYLGYPGTLGADYIDYIIADKTIIPESHQLFYTEKVVSLPNTYMVDDSERLPSSRVYTRLECGLPDDAFVFCCFNNSHKFNAQVIDSWSRILLGNQNSVLWISENNTYFQNNIRSELHKRGIEPARIIFAPRVDGMGDHLARYNVADLFLDTHPYNAHTTAVDSLKTGTPLITLIGESFPARVAASLLHAINLPELITKSWDAYVELAIELSNNPQKLSAIKEKLQKNKLTTPLFNTPIFTRHIESAYIKMYERNQSNLVPDHLIIE